MKIIKVKDYDDLGKQAASYLIKKVQNSPNLKIGLATGATPEGMYHYIVKDHLINKTSYRNITTFNLDEYIGLSDHKKSFRYFMDTHLFNHLDINKSNTYIPHGDVKDFSLECSRYEKLIKEKGGIDLQLIGIGGNGHVGFNEPGSSFQSRTRIVKLADKTRIDNAKYFDSFENVPTHAITMGIATIMESKEILLIASGERKREAIQMLLDGKINENFPASILHNHPCITVIVDEAAMVDFNQLL